MKCPLFFIIFFLTATVVVAADKTPEAGQNVLEKAAIQKNIELSESIDSLADQIDLFFAGRRLTNKPNDSSLLFSYFGHQTEGEKYEDNDVRVDFQLRLPNTEEYWQLFFTSDEDSEFQSLASRRLGASPGRQSYGVGVGLGKKIGSWRTLFRPGLKIKDPIETSYILSLKNKIEIKKFDIQPQFSFFADSQKGTGQEIDLNIDYQYTRSVVFRWMNGEQYLDLGNVFSTVSGPAILYKKSDKVSYTTSLAFYSTNQPVYHLDQYTYLISRRQEIYKNILYYQLTPSWTFAKGNDWKPRFDTAIHVDLVF